jgi:hypothetical protein
MLRTAAKKVAYVGGIRILAFTLLAVFVAASTGVFLAANPAPGREPPA